MWLCGVCLCMYVRVCMCLFVREIDSSIFSFASIFAFGRAPYPSSFAFPRYWCKMLAKTIQSHIYALIVVMLGKNIFTEEHMQKTGILL